MLVARNEHTATLLDDGSILVIGGAGESTLIERFNPETGSFTEAGNLIHFRVLHSASLMSDGRVLITGGIGSGSAEIFDPVTNKSHVIDDVPIFRRNHTTHSLPDGRVVIAYGLARGGNHISDVEIFDPTTESFENVAASQSTMREGRSFKLNDGSLIFVGGMDLQRDIEIYYPPPK